LQISKKPKTFILNAKHLVAGMAIIIFNVLLASNYFISYHRPIVEVNCDANLPAIYIKNNQTKTGMDDFVLTTVEAIISQNSHVHLQTKECTTTNAPIYVLEISSALEGSNHNTLLTVKNSNDAKVLAFSKINISLESKDPLNVIFYELASEINNIIKPYGLLMQNSFRHEWGNPSAKEQYNCLFQMYNYFTTDSQKDYNDVHECLTESSKLESVSLDISGALAASYLEQANSYRTNTVENPILQAKEILNENQGLINLSVELMIAKLTFEANKPDFNEDELDNALLMAENSFPTNPYVMMTAAGYSGLKLGDWERATRLSNLTKKLTKQRDHSLYAVDAFNLILTSSNFTDFENCFKYYSENSLLTNLVVKTCAKMAGDNYWLEKTQKSLEGLDYDSTDKQIAFLRSKRWDPRLIDGMSRSLSE